MSWHIIFVALSCRIPAEKPLSECSGEKMCPIHCCLWLRLDTLCWASVKRFQWENWNIFKRCLDVMGSTGQCRAFLQACCHLWLCQQGTLTPEVLGKDQIFGQQMWVQAGSRVLVHVQERGGGAALIPCFRGGFNKGTVLAEGFSGCHFPSILNTTPLLSL